MRKETYSSKSDEQEKEQWHKYRHCYTPQHYDLTKIPPSDYFAKLAAARFQLVRELYRGGRVLDLCCGAGDYLLEVARFTEKAIGVDFSPEMISVVQQRIVETGQSNVACCVGNARAMPLKDESVSLIFSFSSFYSIPRVDQAVQECARVLQSGGTAILEFGALYSLNTVVGRAHAELAGSFHVPLSAIHQMLAAANLKIQQDRAFQLLPLWGSKPLWLRPLLHPGWKRLMSLPVGNRMLDEVLASRWPLNNFAFRHLVVCRKP